MTSTKNEPWKSWKELGWGEVTEQFWQSVKTAEMEWVSRLSSHPPSLEEFHQEEKEDLEVEREEEKEEEKVF